MKPVFATNKKGVRYETCESVMAREVEWYRKNGRHKDRLTRSTEGNVYVISDWSWNRKHPDRKEWVESDMSRDLHGPCQSGRGW